jgi:hypothetical protein
MRTVFWNLIAFASIALLPAILPAQALPDNPEPAPSGRADWARVQDLANGEQITVARPGSFSVPCRFAGATKDDLFCDSLFSGREYRFNRSEVARVRMDDKKRNMHILIGALAVAGLVWGVATPPGNGTPRALDGLAGAGAGAFAGLVVSLPAALLIPGRTVYRQSITDRKPHSSGLPRVQAPAQPGPVEPAP